jgi:hypothetical protein
MNKAKARGRRIKTSGRSKIGPKEFLFFLFKLQPFYYYYFLGWLGQNKLDDSNINTAYCAYCRTSLRAHIADLKRHANTILHKRNVETRVVKKRTMKQFFPSTSLNQQVHAKPLQSEH